MYSCNRTWRPIGLWDVEILTLSKKFGDEVLLLTNFPPNLFSVRRWVNTRGILLLEGLGKLKI
jgi:hypothetical protein